jgi:hypothetical protein
MGLTKDFFTKPILVTATFRQQEQTANGAEFVDYPASFLMNRESVGQRNGVAVAASLFNDADNFERFCKLLASEPQGFDDFPKDDTPLEKRAREYFGTGGYRDLIQYVVMEVERAQKPIEFFRSF